MGEKTHPDWSRSNKYSHATISKSHYLYLYAVICFDCIVFTCFRCQAKYTVFARLIIFHLVGQTRVFARPIMAPRPYGWHHYISTWNVVFPRFNKNLKWQYRFAKTEETLYVAYLVSFHAEHSTTPVTLLLHPSLSLSWEQPAASRG